MTQEILNMVYGLSQLYVPFGLVSNTETIFKQDGTDHNWNTRASL